MQIDFQWPMGWAVAITCLLTLLLAVQLILIIRNNGLSLVRKTVRFTFNLLFVFSIILLLFRPYWIRAYTPKNILVHDGQVSQHDLNLIKDSLNLTEILSIDHYENGPDNIHLVGQHYTPVQMAKLQYASQITWLPNRTGINISDIRWNGVLRQGQNQKIYGTYLGDEDAILSIRYGEEMLDTVHVGPHHTTFTFTVQPKALGRNNLTLLSEGKELGQIRFYVIQNNPVHYKMLFSYPDMEIRHLSEWLGKRGQGISTYVYTSTSVIHQSTNIEKTDTLQFIITEPAYAGSSEVKAAIESGASVLFTNFSDVEKELLLVNRTLETDWAVNKTNAESNRTIDGALTALPYKFITQPHQWKLLDDAVGFQRVGRANVGVSLLEATFPIALQGDSLGYADVWDNILYAMRPAEGITFQVPHPLFTGIGSPEWSVNSPLEIEHLLTVASDSIFLIPSSINPLNHTAVYKAFSSGWNTLADTLEVYVYGQEDGFSAIRQKNQINQFIQYHRQQRKLAKDPIFHIQQLSHWWWFGLVIFSATLLWMEPRFNA
ncbi:hypothetical protein [Anditalea andensis]|uniref:Aerotolerance regulator N-terminal domain-containing protein n=1 Tax=Anditalea andensis TaxID=1048983 RepID=A0A074L1Z7_9BACT|nr:hypothetical protein [Anditalea andensis]KEO75169.1 hypothetical protein EL17_05735 [Anditalea andensis]